MTFDSLSGYRTATNEERYFKSINPALLREQRRLLARIVPATGADEELLEGLMNGLDAVADYLADVLGHTEALCTADNDRQTCWRCDRPAKHAFLDGDTVEHACTRCWDACTESGYLYIRRLEPDL